MSVWLTGSSHMDPVERFGRADTSSHVTSIDVQITGTVLVPINFALAKLISNTETPQICLLWLHTRLHRNRRNAVGMVISCLYQSAKSTDLEPKISAFNLRFGVYIALAEDDNTLLESPSPQIVWWDILTLVHTHTNWHHPVTQSALQMRIPSKVLFAKTLAMRRWRDYQRKKQANKAMLQLPGWEH